MSNKTQENKIIKGEITEALPNTMFKVQFVDETQVLCTLAGKMRKHYVRLFPGDNVEVEMTPYDDKRGRIIRKLKF